MLAGAGITLEITALSVGFGLLIGMMVGVARLATIKPVRYLANCYVDFIRGTPHFSTDILVYFALPGIIDICVVHILPLFLPVPLTAALILQKFSVLVSSRSIKVKWKQAVL